MKQQQGFTLIELIVVIVILGILSAVAMPKFMDLRADATSSAVKAVAGGMTSASAINAAGCAMTGDVAVLNKCIKVDKAAKTCRDVVDVMDGSVAIAAGVIPALTVAGTYYLFDDTLALTKAGTTCTLVLGDGSAAGVSATYTAYSTN